MAARAALAELRESGGLIPNQAMLINSIPLLEAQASSEIENIVTTADRLFRYANDATGRAIQPPGKLCAIAPRYTADSKC